MIVRTLALAGLVLVVMTPLARAGDVGAALSWTRLPGAERCLDAPELARAVEARIGAVLVTPAHAALSIEGRIAPRSGGGWRAVIAVAHAGRPATSQRTIETANRDCRVLDASLALVVALLVDPTQSPPPSPPQPEVIIREVPVIVHEPWHVALVLRAAGEWGALADLTGGGEVAVVVTPPRLWDVELVGFWDHSVEVATDLADRTVRETLAGGSVAVCPRWQVDTLGLVACGGVRLARLAWRGHGFDQNSDGSALVPALAGDARIEAPLGSWLRVVAGLGVRVPLRHVSLSYNRSASVGGGVIEIDHTALASLILTVGVVAWLF